MNKSDSKIQNNDSKKLSRYGEILNYRINQIFRDTNGYSVHAGSGRGLIALIPLLVISSFFEFIWKKLKNR